ncbi:MAG: transposase [Atopobiaceae bacterium]|nr:transposase [Atopobiaceae bacterium]
MLSADCVEADDFYIGARAGGTRGRGTERQPMLAAVDRAPAGKGSCVIRCAEDCSGDSWRQFGHDHLCHASTIRADAWTGISAGLSSFRGLEQKEYDSSDSDAALPMVHRIISNFKAYVGGAFHGLSKAHMQSYADSFSWRYSHRDSGDAFGDLLHGMCLMHVPLSRIAATATIQPKLPKQLTVHGV